ncbi:hypothetical protein QUF94_16410 [Peribacillus sp. NJ4]|nr:hypothetical protein [Peribacillus sp. NJ4]MDM5213002.1 hypothetical protein [Peribacillus sp. NJ4]
MFLINYRGRIVEECCLIFIQQLGQFVEEEPQHTAHVEQAGRIEKK